MFDKDDILAMLNDGESASYIADQFTAALNAAIKENSKSKEKEKQKAMKEIFGGFVDYLYLYTPDLIDEELADALLDDEFIKEMVSFVDKLYREFAAAGASAKTNAESKKSFAKTSDEKLNEFLKKNGLI